MTPWKMDHSEPLITPDRLLGYYAQLLGSDGQELSLPDLLVATFQERALHHLVARVGGNPPTRWPTPVFWPLSRGSYRGRPLAVARLPVGAAASAMALELMIAAGVRTVVLVGSAGSLQPHLPAGSLVIATRALRHEGTSHHYLPEEADSTASPDLVEALEVAAQRRGLPNPALGAVWTTDALFRECTASIIRHRDAGVLAVEMEASALFAVALHRGIRMGLILALSDELGEGWTPHFHSLTFARSLLAAADIALDSTDCIPPSL